MVKKNKKNKKNNDLDKFNTMIDQATQAITCDSNCQKQMTIDDLKRKYLNAQTNLATAPNQVATAKKNYVVYSLGQTSYDDQVDKDLTKKAKELASFYAENFNKESQNVYTDIETYSGLLANLRNVFDLNVKYKKENVELQKKIKEESNDILTNERKTYYQDEGIENLKFVYYYFLLSIYVICLILFAIFNFVYPSQISWKIRLAVFIVLLLLPFVSTWILGKIVVMIYNIYHILPTNVHKTL
jgi:4-amino-4-deoxy-L-arabinose transferase-like glycosyltransferase